MARRIGEPVAEKLAKCEQLKNRVRGNAEGFWVRLIRTLGFSLLFVLCFWISLHSPLCRDAIWAKSIMTYRADRRGSSSLSL